MKLSVALFFAGLFGALATLAILLSFGTDYWLVAYETCPDPENTGTPVEVSAVDVALPSLWVSRRLCSQSLTLLVVYAATASKTLAVRSEIS